MSLEDSTVGNACQHIFDLDLILGTTTTLSLAMSGP